MISTGNWKVSEQPNKHSTWEILASGRCSWLHVKQGARTAATQPWWTARSLPAWFLPAPGGCLQAICLSLCFAWVPSNARRESQALQWEIPAVSPGWWGIHKASRHATSVLQWLGSPGDPCHFLELGSYKAQGQQGGQSDLWISQYSWRKTGWWAPNQDPHLSHGKR